MVDLYVRPKLHTTLVDVHQPDDGARMQSTSRQDLVDPCGGLLGSHQKQWDWEFLAVIHKRCW